MGSLCTSHFTLNGFFIDGVFFTLFFVIRVKTSEYTVICRCFFGLAYWIDTRYIKRLRSVIFGINTFGRGNYTRRASNALRRLHRGSYRVRIGSPGVGAYSFRITSCICIGRCKFIIPSSDTMCGTTEYDRSNRRLFKCVIHIIGPCKWINYTYSIHRPWFKNVISNHGLPCFLVPF